ncbi:unnamed protein product [Leptidea sinapis]|uniref:HTH psq-type domain-containing protein n=1 Tax=Leptidea sinapis TaxID=189913 RepID=A0A5E4PQZ3_9NEOP|nr:unnamed protein product [Leptidea sinapis]
MRNYKRKTERGMVSIELLQRAADAVIKDSRKLKTVARELEICHMTLFRFVKKLKAGVTPTVTRIESATNEPQPGSSNIANLPNNLVIQATSTIFSPEAIKPLPKAPPRSCVTTRRRIRKSAILTDTPEKNALAEEKARKVKSNRKIKAKEVEKRVRKNKVTGKKKRNYKVASKSANGKENVKRKLLQEDNHGSDSEEETMEWYCLICCDLYSNSRPGEQWIECVLCKNWAHSKCLKSEDVHS